jgi:hypothetical protein
LSSSDSSTTVIVPGFSVTARRLAGLKRDEHDAHRASQLDRFDSAETETLVPR